MAVGAKVSITTIPGYLPIRGDYTLEHTYRSNAELLMGSEGVFDMGHRSGSTDMGDVSHLIPAIHPYVSVATGKAHGDDYVIQDYKLGVSTSAKIMATTIIDLLANGGLRAREIIDGYTPSYTKKHYISLLRGLAKEETYK
jgi:metal-dependent amidase/aminoacylase/carboxypeptidase family protein